MTKVRRRAGWLVAGMVAVSLVMVPREGAASGPFRWPDPPPELGEPDTPPHFELPSWLRDLRPVLTIPQVGIVYLVPRAATATSPSLTQRSRVRVTTAFSFSVGSAAGKWSRVARRRNSEGAQR